jgi:dihydroxyacetone kinase-like predicted kinase
MEVQARQFVRSHMLPAGKLGETITNTAIVCVVPGRGLAEIFRSLGASLVLPGGQTMNPSTQELLEAVNQLETDNVLILPNNSNVILAAQQAQNLASKNVRVVATKTIPQGIAALLSFNYQADLETNARLLWEASQKVDTVEITRSVRDTRFSGLAINSGDIIGLLNETLVSVGQDYDQVALDVLARLGQNGAGPAPQPDFSPPDFSRLAGKYELITIYFGQDLTERQARRLADKICDACPDVAVEIHEGGQLFYPYIISLE